MIQEEDTPKFFFCNGNYDKTRKLLTRIGRKNNVLNSTQKFTKKFKVELQESE
jgi:hypothetical protein